MRFRPDSVWGSGKSRRRGVLAMALVSSAIPVQAAMAQNAAPAAPVPTAPAVTPPPAGPVIPPPPAATIAGPTGSAVVNLIRLLVEQGILTQDRANALIRQAEDEAALAARTAGAPSPPPSAPGAMPPASASTSVRVPYVPEIVRRQIEDEVREDVLAQVRQEYGDAREAVPEWTKRFSLYGDLRLRYEWDLFDNRNVAFPNFAALNAGAPFDLNNAAGTPPPILNTTADRQRMRIRGRLGLNAAISDQFQAGIRLATGNTSIPTTTNQTLGSTFNKYTFQLDRFFVRYDPTSWARLWGGRFESPFLSTELVWDEDIAFDGVAAQAASEVMNGFGLFSAAGAFPIENTPLHFPDNSSVKEASRDKWLFAGQLGVQWHPSDSYDFKLASAYYHYSGIEGLLSSPCTVLSALDPCSTDHSRPGFVQQGNTLFAIRDLVLPPGVTNPPLFQYYGLASPFHELNLTARFDYAGMMPAHVIVGADFVTNLAFDAGKIAALSPVNNLGAVPTGGGAAPFVGGNKGYQASLTVGYPVVRQRGDWNVGIVYRYLESDATVDAFNDSDFHLYGGTNAKGYIFGGVLGVANNVNLTARWFSASEVSGPPFSVDVIMVDINAQF